MNIQFLERDEIDRLKWDSCVHYAVNGLVYGYTWFLDNVTEEEWTGVVEINEEGNYVSVMPLPFNSKLKICKQVYMPPFVGQLGVFSVFMPTKERLEKIISAIPTEYKYSDYIYNSFNNVLTGESFTEVDNHIMYLNSPYPDIANKYDKELLAKVDFAAENQLTMQTGVSPEKFVEFFERHQRRKYSEKEFTFLKFSIMRIIYQSMHRGISLCTSVVKDGEVLAMNFYVFSHSRVVNIFSINSEEGRKYNAIEYLYDQVVQINADKPLVFDLGRTTDLSMSSLYESFAAEKEVCFHSVVNKLPLLVKLFKK